MGEIRKYRSRDYHLKGCQVVSPHCLVAPGYVAPTEVTSPQHRSCVAPTSWLCRPNIKVASPQRVTSLIKEKFARLLGCNSSKK